MRPRQVERKPGWYEALAQVPLLSVCFGRFIEPGELFEIRVVRNGHVQLVCEDLEVWKPSRALPDTVVRYLGETPEEISVSAGALSETDRQEG